MLHIENLEMRAPAAGISYIDVQPVEGKSTTRIYIFLFFDRNVAVRKTVVLDVQVYHRHQQA